MGADKIATKASTETKIIFKMSIFLLKNDSIFFFIFTMFMTNKAWATISKIIKPKSMNRLKNLYKSVSKLIPRNIECEIKNIADPTPNNKKCLFLLVPSLIA